jgi:hypothetical protein
MYKMVTAFAGMLVCASAAFAGDGYGRPSSSGGLSAYVGAHAGVTIANTEISAELFGAAASLDGIGSHGAIGGVHAGLDYTLPFRVFVGLYGFYDWQSTESSLKLDDFSASVDFGGSYGVGGRLGYDWGKAKAYALLGWRHTDLSWGATGADPGDFAGFPSSLNGIDVGAGMAIPLAQGLELGIEGVWTKYKSESINDTVALDPTQLSVMGRLSIRFGN